MIDPKTLNLTAFVNRRFGEYVKGGDDMKGWGMKRAVCSVVFCLALGGCRSDTYLRSKDLASAGLDQPHRHAIITWTNGRRVEYCAKLVYYDQVPGNWGTVIVAFRVLLQHRGTVRFVEGEYYELDVEPHASWLHDQKER